MVKIKSFSVGYGDMFYIDHLTDNFTIIDCKLSVEPTRKEDILNEIAGISANKGLTRFISTHPDEDHINGIQELDDRIGILNFYCVNNSATKETETESFKHYKELKNNTAKAFYIYKGCNRKWMNTGNNERGSAGINVCWPILSNDYFKTEQENAAKGQTANNLSPIITYKLEDGAVFAWMGDLETSFMANIIDEIRLPKVNVLFAPHHGRTSGIVPDWWLDQMNPDVIVLGEAPEEYLADYDGYNTIRQNDAGNINFYLETGVIDIFVENPLYQVGFLEDNYLYNDEDNEFYLGSVSIPV